MLTLDGSIGEGGGQILRSALALSMVSGTPFRIEKIRARRPKPGLMRQHLTAVLAAAKICGATLDGAQLHSQELSFAPGAVEPGDYTFAIGSAGSTTLVLQTVLPPLLTASGPSAIRLEGGTHNIHAPPFDFLAGAFVPLINRMGPQVTLSLERYGFYPAGGGRMTVRIDPAPSLMPLHLSKRNPLVRRMATSIVAGLPRDIGDRELAVVADKLDWPPESLQFRHLPSGHGQGNILLLEIADDSVTEVFTGFGQRGISAERVASGACQNLLDHLKSEAAIGEHLADQLLLPLALAGRGSFLTSRLSQHSRTNIDTIGKFLDRSVSVTEASSATDFVDIR